MTAAMQHLFVLAVLLSATHAAGQAEEPNDKTIRPVFEVSPAALGTISPESFMGHVRPPRPSGTFYKPAYAAAIALEGPSLFLTIPGEHMSSFLGFAQERGGLSGQQRLFLEATRGLLDSDNVLVRRRLGDDPNSPVRLLLYAMTLEDAKRMAQAYVEYTMSAFKSRMESTEQALAERQAKIAAAEKKLRELDAVAKTAEESLVEVQKRVGYRTRQEAMEAIAELDRMRNAAQVDIAGIQAKISAIQRHRQEQTVRVEDLWRLDLMFVEEAVALEGAEARRKMATQLRAEANKFVDIRQTIESAGAQKEQLLDEMTPHKRVIVDLQHGLQYEMKQRPQVADSPIIIYPIEWAAEDQGN